MDELEHDGKRDRSQMMPKRRAQARIQEQLRSINPVLVNPEEFSQPETLAPLFYWMLKRRIISSFNHPAFCSPEGGASLALQAFLRSSRTPSSPKLL
jgi:hypothetical protein